VGQDVAMRVHISLDDGLVAEVDRRVGARRRSAFIAEALRRALEDEQRWELIASAIGSIASTGHDWDDDSRAWVRAQRRADAERVG
jgi:metal-responsive CopG/Arc/MetJ family transcriptional regulator